MPTFEEYQAMFEGTTKDSLLGKVPQTIEEYKKAYYEWLYILLDKKLITVEEFYSASDNMESTVAKLESTKKRMVEPARTFPADPSLGIKEVKRPAQYVQDPFTAEDLLKYSYLLPEYDSIVADKTTRNTQVAIALQERATTATSEKERLAYEKELADYNQYNVEQGIYGFNRASESQADLLARQREARQQQEVQRTSAENVLLGSAGRTPMTLPPRTGAQPGAELTHPTVDYGVATAGLSLAQQQYFESRLGKIYDEFETAHPGARDTWLDAIRAGFGPQASPSGTYLPAYEEQLKSLQASDLPRTYVPEGEPIGFSPEPTALSRGIASTQASIAALKATAAKENAYLSGIEQPTPKAPTDPWQTYIKRYPFLQEYYGVSPTSRGEYTSTHAPLTRWFTR